VLFRSYAQGEAYQYGAAFLAAAEAVLGRDLATLLQRHVLLLQSTGLDRIEPDTLAALRERYGAFDHPGAREVLAFLDGGYRMTREMMAEEGTG